MFLHEDSLDRNEAAIIKMKPEASCTERVEVVDTTVESTIDPRMTLLSTCAAAIVLPACWQFAASTLVAGIYGGGPPVEIWGTLATGLALSIFCSSLAEFASAFPSPAGCTHIAAQVASPSWAPFVSYLTGSIHSWAVFFTPAALLLTLVNLLITCVCVMRPEYHPAKYQIFLVYQGVNISFFFALKYGTVVISFLLDTGMILFVVGFFVTVGCVLGFSSDAPRPSNESIWSSFSNNTGFSSSALGALLGLTGPLYAYGAPHWLLNMAEDIKNPSRNIPLGMVAQQVGGITTLFAYYVAIFYSLNDFSEILTTTYPSIVGAVYEQATGRAGVALALLLFIFIPQLLGTFGYISASIRLAYGFARYGAFTHAKWWSKIHPRYNIPINVLYIVTLANFVLGFVYLASPLGFQILLGSAIGLYVWGYIPMLFAVVVTRRHFFYSNLQARHPGRKPYYSLPRALGVAFDTFSLIFEVLVIVIYCLPAQGPVNVRNFNWVPLFMVFVVVVSLLTWFSHGRKVYTVEVLRAIERSAEAHHVPTM